MCHESCLQFGVRSLTEDDVKDKLILDVGSYNFNGSFRSIITPLHPQQYIGIDMIEGLGVDVVCNAENLIEKFGENSFDVVISSEMLEHAQNWKLVIHNIKAVLKPKGLLVLTTRSKGFPEHAYPDDFWRFEVRDMQQIFSDLKIYALVSDSETPGVFIKCRKPIRFKERNLDTYEVFSMKDRID